MIATNLCLLNVPFTDYSNEFYFANDTLRENYFKSKKIENVNEELTEFNYIRKDSTIDVPFSIDDVIECNYVMYKNTNYENKWFYCFVTDIEFIAQEVTRLHIKEDSYQTWISECTFYPSFVEREHVSDDTIGLHTVQENLDVRRSYRRKRK